LQDHFHYYGISTETQPSYCSDTCVTTLTTMLFSVFTKSTNLLNWVTMLSWNGRNDSGHLSLCTFSPSANSIS